GGGTGPEDAAGVVPGEGGVGDQADVVGRQAGAAGGQFADIGQDGGHTLLSLTPSSPVSPRSQAPLGNASPRSSASRLDRGNGPASGGRREAELPALAFPSRAWERGVGERKAAKLRFASLTSPSPLQSAPTAPHSSARSNTASGSDHR